MLFGKRRPRKSDARRRTLDIHRPRGEALEDRLLLSIDLGGTSPPSNPIIASAPYGMAFGNSIAGGGAGWSVSDLGDVNGDGYDDFMIGAPTVSSPSTIGSGINGEAFLIFGSNTVNAAAITDWIGTTSTSPLTYTYTANDRVGNLGQLGAATQTNPASTATLDFPFAGITFVTSGGNILSGLGASVSSVKLSSGTYGILIGAPFGTDVNDANIGTGRAYLISGNLNNFIGQTINLDTPTNYSGLNIVTFVNTATGGQLGYSVAGGNNIFGDGTGDIILGAPTRPSARPPAPAWSTPCRPACSAARPRRSTSRRSARAAPPARSSPGPPRAARPAGASPTAATSTASPPAAPTSMTC